MIADEQLRGLWRDARHGTRRWLATPLLTVMMVCSLAIGIGANLAAFALVNAIFFRPLPVRDPGTLLKVGLQGADAMFSVSFWRLLETQREMFHGSAASAVDRLNVRWRGQAKLVEGLFVSRDFFQVIGVPLFIGNSLDSADDASAVLSYAFWQAAFEGDPRAIGETISVGKSVLTIVGVARPEFFGTEIGRRVDLYVPLAAERNIAGNESRLENLELNWLSIFARQKDSQSSDESEMALRSLERGLPDAARGLPSQIAGFAPHLALLPASEGRSLIRTQFGKPLWIIFGAVFVVLLIACANIATVFLARIADRETEIALRRTLGSSRWAVVRGLLIESMLLTAVGSVLGIALAMWLTNLVLPSFVTPLDRGLQPYLAIQLDVRLVAGAVLLLVVSTLACSLLPALRVLGRVSAEVSSSGRATALQRESFSGRMLMLLGAQIALSLVLVSASGLFVRSFFEIIAQPTAIDKHGVVLASIEGEMWQKAPVATLQHVDDLLGRLTTQPSVDAVSISVLTPLSGIIMLSRVQVPGFRSIDPRSVNASVNRVTPGFFDVFGTRLLAGRGFSQRDGMGAPRVGIVNEAFANLYMAGDSPIGKMIKLNEEGVEIIGVVETGKYMNLHEPTMRFVYLPLAQWVGPKPVPLRIGVRTANPEAAKAELISTIRRFDPELGLEFRNLKDEVDSSANRERLMARLSACLASLALVIAGTGLYGTFSYLVHRRRAELALRIALGADGAAIRRLIGRDAVVVLGLGSVVGFAGVMASGRFVAAILFGVTPADPLVLSVSWICLAFVAGVATLLPTVRASRVDPMIALRSE